MKSVQMACIAAAVLAIATAALAAQPLTLGKPAPADVVQQLKSVPPVKIGAASVRPVTPSGAVVSATAQPGRSAGSDTTMVVRTSDNVVGTSTNDLVVIHPNTAAVRQAAPGLAKSVSAYPEMGVAVIHAGGLDQLASIKATLATRFPTAEFDLPVRFGNIQPK